MDNILDETAIVKDVNTVKYAGFWVRVGALIIDTIILAPVAMGLTYFNITTWKSSAILIAISLISTGYKPLLEFISGATWGKMAMNLKVVNLQFQKPTLKEAVLRNIINIGSTVITLLFSLMMFSDPDFENVTGYFEYSDFTKKFMGMQMANLCIGLLTIVDGIMLLADERKRTLHDRIGETFVVEK
jgi:uncharacterized RDD family membrane protein YckC